jgi:hypothetical protein
MTFEEHNKIIKDIAQNLSDQAKVTELLTSLSNDYNETLTTISSLEPLKDDNEKLRNANMQLFLQVGDTSKLASKEEVPQDTGKKEEDKKPSYEELFNEKGELI